MVQQSSPTGVFPRGTPVGGTQDNPPSSKGDFGQHLSELREWGVSIAQPRRSAIEAISVIEIPLAIELHHMLLFTREQFHLNFIQVNLQGGQPISQDRPHQLIVFSSIKPVHVA